MKAADTCQDKRTRKYFASSVMGASKSPVKRSVRDRVSAFEGGGVLPGECRRMPSIALLGREEQRKTFQPPLEKASTVMSVPLSPQSIQTSRVEQSQSDGHAGSRLQEQDPDPVFSPWTDDGADSVRRSSRYAESQSDTSASEHPRGHMEGVKRQARDGQLQPWSTYAVESREKPIQEHSRIGRMTPKNCSSRLGAPGGQGGLSDRRISPQVDSQSETSASEHCSKDTGAPSARSLRASYLQSRQSGSGAETNFGHLLGQGPLPVHARSQPGPPLVSQSEVKSQSSQLQEEIQLMQERLERTEALLRAAQDKQEGPHKTINLQVLVEGPQGFSGRICGLAGGLARRVGQSARQIAGNRSVQASAGGAVLGATAMGTVGATSGVVVGSTCGAVVGIVPAFFTFGLSIPVGAAVVGCAGLCAGGAIGTTAGAVGGGVAGLLQSKCCQDDEVKPARIECAKSIKDEPHVETIYISQNGPSVPKRGSTELYDALGVLGHEAVARAQERRAARSQT